MKFGYGDAVIAEQAQADGNISNRPCSVVAITPIKTEDEARTFGSPIGTILYTVEFPDGTDATLPEDVLTPY